VFVSAAVRDSSSKRRTNQACAAPGWRNRAERNAIDTARRRVAFSFCRRHSADYVHVTLVHKTLLLLLAD